MASKGVNKVIVVGNLGEDPTVNYTPAGAAITNISVATSESWKDKNTGQMQNLTEWHRVVFFGKLAEIAGEYLKKGSQVYIEGKLKTRKWQDKQGQDKYTTEIVVDGFSGVLQMLGSKQEGQRSAPTQGAIAPQQQAPSQAPQAAPQQGYQQQPQQQQVTSQANQQAPQGRQVGGGEYAPQATAQPMDNSFDSDIPF